MREHAVFVIRKFANTQMTHGFLYIHLKGGFNFPSATVLKFTHCRAGHKSERCSAWSQRSGRETKTGKAHVAERLPKQKREASAITRPQTHLWRAISHEPCQPSHYTDVLHESELEPPQRGLVLRVPQSQNGHFGLTLSSTSTGVGQPNVGDHELQNLARAEEAMMPQPHEHCEAEGGEPIGIPHGGETFGDGHEEHGLHDEQRHRNPRPQRALQLPRRDAIPGTTQVALETSKGGLGAENGMTASGDATAGVTEPLNVLAEYLRSQHAAVLP